ncbi:MAG TPA: PEGA domain-containing protein, partial [Candidatus Acidoferrum sp.]|nr:PEGA domain-containing protein [Candidatus Acidoferrum sp.]
MLRRLAALVACVLLLAVAATGSVYVTTLPTGADVWVDGIYVGRTPVVLDALAAGHHTLGLTKSGWNPEQLDVTVEGGQTTLSSSRLTLANQPGPRPTGTIVVRGVDMRGLKVDGVAVGAAKDGSFPAPAGLHEVTVESPKGRFTRQITVWPQTRTEVVVQPEDQPSRPSIVAPAEDYLPKSAVR